MRILIVSDTHGKDENLEYVLENCGEIDGLIHAGDVQHSADYIRELAGCPVYMVKGNNDFFSDLPEEAVFMLGKYRCLLTHGHSYCVNAGYETIRREGRARGVDIVIFGHTHRPLVEIEENLIVINPGSISYPRQDGKYASYIIMEINAAGEAEFFLEKL